MSPAAGIRPITPQDGSAGDVAYSPRRKLALLVVAAVWVGITALIVATALRSSPPPADAVAGPYSQRFPAIRLFITILATIAGFTLWAVRARLVDTPVLELAGVRPGRAVYRGTVRAERPVVAPLTGSSCAWYRTVRMRDSKFVAESAAAARIELTDPTAAIDLDPTMIARGPNRRVVFQRGAGRRREEERVLLDGDLVTIYAEATMGHQGHLRLGEPTGGLARRRPFTHVRRNGVVGDAHRAMFLLRVAAAATLVAACVMWISLWLVQTWETSFGESRHSALVLPDRPARTAVAVIVCTLVFAAFAAAVVIANRLIMLRQQITFAVAAIDVAAQQRHDVIGSLLDAVRGAIEHERTTLRGAALVRADGADRADVERLEAQRARVSTQPLFAQLMAELVACENRLAAARRFHNDAVTVAKDRGGVFPAVLLRPVIFLGGVPPLLHFELG